MGDHISLLPPDACAPARQWLASLPPGTTPQQAWDQCTDPRWMLWLLAYRADRQTLALAVCAVVRPALVHVPAGEDRPHLCIETVERWARGEATIEEVRAARQGAAAYAIDTDTDAAYAGYAADAAADAAAAADADYAAAAAADAAYAGAAAYAAAERADVRRRCCDAIRARHPDPPLTERAEVDDAG